jgi:hypothetical protein
LTGVSYKDSHFLTPGEVVHLSGVHNFWSVCYISFLKFLKVRYISKKEGIE